ncbi:aspartyl-phosphate phosphatase Spo0E family protein [Brevibacillus halotolerans]|uniref:aspartyl-phosphate phosphatase Spo0E family protein n=1 Tax=Brevibacillus TaxID=55080 RepID=UPI00215CA94B|nr:MULTISPECIES: aspartyl-phosphate phosphatase Spo0E family protein [Brevibacillus]MCR8964214.1 aspartyl-phosphate phosphatase Spo0E family protein [Brevibacillus laterosporus]MCZ0836369.1 aspartyl-phosphate phosphatase Spo0E family protein [Brevibacillus halotolerans]
MTQEISTANSRTGRVENLLKENDLQKLIEVLRKELEELYLKKGSFLHPAVQQISQQLDEYIVAFQKLSKHLERQ